MSYGRYLRELLAPLRLYDLEAPFNGGELNVQGGALDGVDTWLAELRRESTLAEAESWGLERIIALLARRPVADTPTGMRKALAALMRIGGDSFTLEAINATISGCGVHAHVEEKEIPGEVVVSFPDIPGIPKGFKEIREIIEDILPAHLGIEYVFWYITWEELERMKQRSGRGPDSPRPLLCLGQVLCSLSSSSRNRDISRTKLSQWSLRSSPRSLEARSRSAQSSAP